MFKRGYIIITTILSLVSVKSQAQYDVSFSHYFDMEPSFNAAAVGKSPKLNIAAAYAMELAGFKRNPNTMYAGADALLTLLIWLDSNTIPVRCMWLRICLFMR